MDPFEKAQIGKTGPHVTRLGLGARGIVDPSVDVPDAEAVATVEKALEIGVRYIDTAPVYGLGRSESFVGRVISRVERDSYVLSTKVGRLLDPTAARGWFWDFSRDSVRRSLESSLERLCLDSVDILYIHSPDAHYEQAMSEAFPALAEMRAQGVVKAIGVGITNWQVALRFAQEGDFDCFLLAGRYTLLDQTAQQGFMSYCQEHNISVVIGGPYNSGILASDLGPQALYDYRRAPVEILERARRIRRVCDRYGVPLKAAALQFVLGHPAVASVIPGSSYPEHVEENAEMVHHPIPPKLWEELRQERLISVDAPVPQ